ncbi:MAG: RDD family protein [Candidatus Hodarchaeota archaeon]
MKSSKYEEGSSSSHYLPSGVKLASLGSRIVALFIDFTVFFFLLFFLDIAFWNIPDDMITFIGFLNLISWLTNPISFGFLLIIGLFKFYLDFFLVGIFGFFYWILLEGGNNGQTLGKMFVGIRVVKIDKTSRTISRCMLRDSVIRNLSRIIDGLPFYYIVGLLSIADSDLNQRVGDLLAETIVIKK